jgi:peptidase E
MAFLEHATDAIRSVLGDRSRILFIPFASGDPRPASTGPRRLPG